jgi:hypothetical protein
MNIQTSQGRMNDSNNTHKKPATYVRKYGLSAKQRTSLSRFLTILKKTEKIDLKKGSRYGFSCQLILIR